MGWECELWSIFWLEPYGFGDIVSSAKFTFDSPHKESGDDDVHIEPTGLALDTELSSYLPDNSGFFIKFPQDTLLRCLVYLDKSTGETPFTDFGFYRTACQQNSTRIIERNCACRGQWIFVEYFATITANQSFTPLKHARQQYSTAKWAVFFCFWHTFFFFPRSRGCPKTVIARSEATKQSQKGVENKGIAALPSVARNDENGVLGQPPLCGNPYPV